MSGLSPKDARTLATLDNGERLDYFDEVRAEWRRLLVAGEVDSASSGESKDKSQAAANAASESKEIQKLDKTAANWILHEFGALLSTPTSQAFSSALVPPRTLATILHVQQTSAIDRTTAKSILAKVFNGDDRDINEIIHVESSKNVMSPQQYEDMAEETMSKNPKMVKDIREKGKVGKLQGLLGLMMRAGKGAVKPQKAEEVLRRKLRLAADKEEER